MNGRCLIFLPVRNGGAYLDEAIDSVVAQTDPDWTLVVLENASTDDTSSRLARRRDARIVVAPSDGPLPIHRNWHRALGWLTKDDRPDSLVTFIGHDDRLGPDFVRLIKQLATDHPGATVFAAHFKLIDAKGALLRPCRPMPAVESWDELLAALCWGIRDSYGTGYAFRARDYLAVGGIPDLPRLLYADFLLFTRMARLGLKVCAPATACEYRLHVGSASNDISIDAISAQIAALWDFITIVDAEMADFANTDRGRDALNALIARQLIAFDLPAIRRVLPEAAREGLMRLEQRYLASAGGVSLSAWSGRSVNPARDRIERTLRNFVFGVRCLR